MRAYLQYADKVELIAPTGGVTAGLGYVIGANLFVIAEGAAVATATFVGLRRGMVRIPKSTSDAIVAGARVVWDNAAKENRAASATGLFMVGTAAKAQAAPDLRVDVILDGTSVVAI